MIRNLPADSRAGADFRLSSSGFRTVREREREKEREREQAEGDEALQTGGQPGH